MSQITTFRLLINNSPPLFSPLFLKPRNFQSLNRFSLFTVLSSLPRKQRNLDSVPAKPLKYRSKSKSSLAEKNKREEAAKMVESDSTGFNKRRAEGKDKSDKPKNLQLKTRKLNPVNTICYVQILGTGMDTQDTSPSVLLFFDKQRFIFNAGEVNMWGPSNLEYMVAAMKSFIPNAAMVHTHSFGPSQDPAEIAVPDLKLNSGPFELIKDEVVKLSAIILRPNEDNEPTSCSASDDSGIKLKPGDLSVIYIFELPEIQGKFYPEKAKALGLKAGPKYRELQHNKSVKSDNLDIMVHPSDVMDPPIPGPVVLLVDCPTASHLQNLLSLDSLHTYYTDFSGNPSENVRAVNCVIHLSPSDVTSFPAYQSWMKRFGDAQHIMAGHERKNAEIPVLKSSARIAARLHYLCPRFFPAPGFWSLHSTDGLLLSANSSTEHSQTIISAENLLKFNLRPYANLGLDRSFIPASSGPTQILDELRAEVPEIDNAVKQVSQLWNSPVDIIEEMPSQNNNSAIEEPWFDELGLPSCLQNITREDMGVCPSGYWIVPALKISLLLDCGEGTLGQLKRRFGVEGADNAVRNLRCIWISHIHADHHTGLARILALRRDLLKGVPHDPLLQTYNSSLWDAFEESLESRMDSSSPTNSGSNVDSTLFVKGSPMQSYWKRPSSPAGNAVTFERLTRLKKVLQDAGLETLISFPVVHCPQAFGIVLKASDRIDSAGGVIPGWKVVYSGDTRPCQELIEASRGATVLIHEMRPVARNHSTTKEAIEVGEAAGVYRLILTHFQQRYPKIPVFEDATCINVLPHLKLLFKTEMGNDESDDILPEAISAVS
ncbi:tRNAse Z TRZ4 mitochondrial [Bienertia sinuspersici]